ncbi:MAG: hypothetical protein R3281_04875 [Balneolaceae bacterium]|nr:hypothetical protein [Balneolaceae bacterium]
MVLESRQSVRTSLQGGGYRGVPGSGRSGPESSDDEILVWIEAVGETGKWGERESQIKILNQVDKHFEPRLLPIVRGGTVRIKNSDPIYHNVFSLSTVKRFDVGRRSPKEYIDVQFDQPGTVDIFCDIHSSMHAVVKVLPNRTLKWKKLKGSGGFMFRDVPQGDYRIHFYAVGNRESSVEISAMNTRKITLQTIRLGAP